MIETSSYSQLTVLNTSPISKRFLRFSAAKYTHFVYQICFVFVVIIGVPKQRFSSSATFRIQPIRSTYFAALSLQFLPRDASAERGYE